MAPKPDQNSIKDLQITDNEHQGTNNEHTLPHISSITSQQSSKFRSFWKAGDYDVDSSKSIDEQGELEHARVHPKFLHSNATSHKWAFGAIAELLDNAVDEICKGATFVKLDKISNARDHTPALLFQDNGGGMDPDSMRQCMSLGYSKKQGDTIGQYGNGFKTSTMRLGADVIVFSRTTSGSDATQSVGLLSYTFLRKTGQDDVIVPMIDFELVGDRTQPIIYNSLNDWSSNLQIILEWSPFASEHDLMQQFEDIGSHGTKIVVYNLWQNDDGLLELDFDHDNEDIRLREDVSLEKSLRKNDRLIQSHISHQIRFSLRAYVSILYLRQFKKFDIILRGVSVQQHNILDDLKFTEVVMYKPQLGKDSKEVSVKTDIGFVKEAPLLQVSGFNIYHKNRLIKPFWKVNNDGTSDGKGVVGILEANFIEPAHDKQDFERSTLSLRLETRLKQMVLHFWRTKCHLIGYCSRSSVIRRLRKEFPSQPTCDNAADLQGELASDQPIIALSADVQPITDCQIQADVRCTWSPMEGSRRPGSSTDAALPIDQICEENIQLFARCEEHRQKESELNQMIEKMERELAETKRKCSRLSSYLDTQRKQQHSGKAA
ncbi:hypothetical protein ACHQM5_015460 [Ranunculus cassubicifolius]